MPRIEIFTEIKAKKQLLFDLSRSVDLQKIFAKQTNETAVLVEQPDFSNYMKW